MIYRWDIQCAWNPWLSVGFHIDHKAPLVDLHLPLILITFGRVPQPGFKRSLRRRLMRRVFGEEFVGVDYYADPYTGKKQYK